MTRFEFQEVETPGLVSIVIPTRCGAAYIGETLASIERQSYRDWEVIVVEDGSDDGTREIVEDFRRRCSQRINYSRNPRNLGVSQSRNIAFSQSRGEFIAMVDSDDRWLPDHLSHALARLREPGADLVYSTVVVFEDRTELLLCVWGPDGNDLATFPYGLFRRNFVQPSATVMRRRVLEDVGPWDVDLRYCEDADFWFRCIAAGKRFVHMGGCHCLYRRNHPGAATQRMCETLERFAQVVERYIDLPGLRRRDCVRSASKSYARAAICHAQADPRKDASADRRRAAPLMYRAWKLRPTRVKHLFQAGKFYLKALGTPAPLPAAPAVNLPPQVATSSQRAA